MIRLIFMIFHIKKSTFLLFDPVLHPSVQFSICFCDCVQCVWQWQHQYGLTYWYPYARSSFSLIPFPRFVCVYLCECVCLKRFCDAILSTIFPLSYWIFIKNNRMKCHLCIEISNKINYVRWITQSYVITCFHFIFPEKQQRKISWTRE